MPISFACPKGHQLQVKDEFAGKKAKCPKCGAMMVVPAPAKPEVQQTSAAAEADPGYSIVEDDPGVSVVQDDGGHTVAANITQPGAVESTPPFSPTSSQDHVQQRVVRPSAAAYNAIDVRGKLLWLGAGGLAGFCAVVITGIILLLHFRGASKPAGLLTTSVADATPQQPAADTATPDSPKEPQVAKSEQTPAKPVEGQTPPATAKGGSAAGNPQTPPRTTNAPP